MEEKRTSFVFYTSFAEAIADIGDPNLELAIYRAIVQYATTGTMPKLNGVCRAVMRLIQPQIDANQKRYESGKKGGRATASNNQSKTKEEPKDKQTATKAKPKQNQVAETPNLMSNEEWGMSNEICDMGNEIGDCKGEETPPPSPPPKPTHKKKEDPVRFPSGEFMNVMLSAEEQSKLVERYGHKVTDEYVNKLSGYMKSKGARYKDHYATILNWIRKDHVPEKNAPTSASSDLMARAAQMLAGTA